LQVHALNLPKHVACLTAPDFPERAGLFAVSLGRPQRFSYVMNIRIGALLALVAVLAACGGGGGGSGSGGVPPTGSGGNPTTSPTSPSPGPSSSSSSAPATPTPQPSAAITGEMSLGGNALANATVAFTCGCSAQAGETTTNASGNYTISTQATAIPSVPQPTYTTVPGRNYMVIGYASTGTQTWTMEFLGDTPATNLNLSSSPGNATANVTDTASTAAALYIYAESQNNSDQSFDLWNFNTISTWAAKLRAGSGLSAHETTFMSDVVSQQNAGKSLYPTIPAWNPQAGASTNATISADIKAISTDGTAVDPALPTPCPGPGQCTGAPTP
jgi:hypothetical protein